jgi:tetratricopeptide (TPR) repeat protein
MFASNIEAEALMKQALTLDHDYVDAMLGLVNTWLNMARTGQITPIEFESRAASMLDRVEAIDPGNGWLLAFRGDIAQLRGEDDAALQLAKRAVAAAPGVARLHNILADIYTGQENPVAAVPEMDLALALNPLDTNVVRYRASHLRLAGRLDEAKGAVLRAIERDPQNSSNYWELSENERARGNLVEAIAGELKSALLDRADPESSATLAVVLDEIGETAAADAWLAESLRQGPGNVLAEGAGIVMDYARGQRAAAVDRAMKISTRRREEHHDFWRRAIVFGCLGAEQSGRSAEMRTALAVARVVPADLSEAGFDAWIGTTGSARVNLRRLAALRRCVFSAAPADASRREQWRAILARVEGADWELSAQWQPLAAELRNDREAMIASFLPPAGAAVTNLALREGSAAVLGIGNDPRIVAHFAAQRAQIDTMRAALPAALAKQGLSLLPPTP